MNDKRGEDLAMDLGLQDPPTFFTNITFLGLEPIFEKYYKRRKLIYYDAETKGTQQQCIDSIGITVKD